MVDHESHIDALEAFNKTEGLSSTWSVFIKIDMGSRQAGLTTNSHRLKAVIQKAEKSPAVSIYGFYCHAGHSYGCRTVESAVRLLNEEVSEAAKAATLMADESPVVLSFGATPTAHVITAWNKQLPQHCRLELHAGIVFSIR
jgi:D-serine ammonia-lyase